MSDGAQPLSVVDVLRLSTKLAERMLHIRRTGRTLSVDELAAVVKAAEFLQAHNVPWPPVVTEIIDLLVAQGEAIGAALGETGAELRLLPPPDPSAASRKFAERKVATDR